MTRTADAAFARWSLDAEGAGWIDMPDRGRIPAESLPGGEVANGVLTFLADDAGFDVSAAWFVVKDGCVVGVGGWREPEVTFSAAAVLDSSAPGSNGLSLSAAGGCPSASVN